jgi:tRNA (guanine9-N1)-methyltransferase
VWAVQLALLENNCVVGGRYRVVKQMQAYAFQWLTIIPSLFKWQIIYCYAVNGRCASPGHLWLTGCRGEMENQLQRLPGFDKWSIEKESQSYIEALQDQKENLVYLTADSETVLDELDLKKIYIVGGLVDRNRWKGLTMKKANAQGIQTAKLPISSYLKMSSSQV